MEGSVAGSQKNDRETSSLRSLANQQLDKVKVLREMGAIDIRLQAQEFIYRQTLQREKAKSGRHSLEEVGRSLNAIAQRRRQYFLEYKHCNTIRCVRQWYAWETKRNLETNSAELRTDNAATRGIKMFLHRIDFYSTLLTRFVEYIFTPLQTHFSTSHGANQELELVKEQMMILKRKCESLLSDSTEVQLENANHIEVEQRFPVISVLPRVHEVLHKMVMLAFQWRTHAKFEQQFEAIENRRRSNESEQDLNEKLQTLKGIEYNIRRSKRNLELLEDEIAARLQAISTSNFSQVYAECTEQIEAVRHAYEHCKANLQTTQAAITSVQQNFGRYKVVGQKQKKKLESSLLRRTRKMEELEKIKAELDRLEARKARLDEEEVIWLRGGYEHEIAIIESLKERFKALEDNLLNLEQQRSDLKTSYQTAVEQLLRLGSDYEELNHEYEYVKRLASILLKTVWTNSINQQVQVKPNKVDVNALSLDDAYDMTQPKGVSMLIYNTWQKSPRASQMKKDVKQQHGPSTMDRKNDLGGVLESLLVQLGFYVIKRSSISAKTMRKNMVGLSDQYHGYSGNHNSLMVVAVANSNERGQILGADDTIVPVSEFLSHFTSSRCPSLNGKPKVFLLLLRVTTRDPLLSVVADIKGPAFRKSTRLSVASDLPVYFEPEPLSVGEDFLVARIMYEDDITQDGGPTFGGVTSTPADKEIPWFAKTFVKYFADQAGTVELTELLGNLKRGFRDHFSSPRSDRTSRFAGVQDSDSPFSSMHLRATQRDEHVNIFIDNGLKKKLFLMPGL